MKTLIIPCAGNEKIDGLPLILNRHPQDGIMLAEKLLHGIFSDEYDRIIFAVTPETESKFSVTQAVINKIARSNVIILPGETSGPAETVYRTILQADITGEIAVKDSDNRISLEQHVSGNAIAGLDLMHYDNTIENLRNKSFIILNEQGDVLDIAEKRLRSDIISAGLYCFRNAEDFVSAFERLSDSDYRIQKLYVSHVISYLIGRRNFIFHCSKVLLFEDWSTSESWHKLRRNSSRQKIRLVMADLDGTLFDTCMVNYSAYREALKPFSCKIDFSCDYFCKNCNGRHYREFLPEILKYYDEEILQEIHDRKKKLYKKYINHAKINDALIKILDIFRIECRTALVTTASGENTSDILKAFGLENYFDLVITHEDITKSKPDPEGYIKAMIFFDVRPEECVIFEDSESGIEAAKRSGALYFRV